MVGLRADWKGLGLLYFLQGVNHLLGFLTVPYLARVLGPWGYGQVAFALGLVGYLNLLVGYSFDLSGPRRAAKAPPQELAVLVAEVLGGRLLLLGGALVLAYSLLRLPALAQGAHLLPLLLGMVVAQALSPAWLLLGRGHAAWTALLELGQRALTLLGLLLWVRSPGDGSAYALLASAAALLASGAGWVLAFRLLGIRPVLPRGASSLRALREGGWLFLSQGASMGLTGGNAFLLGLFAGPQAVAPYAAAEKLVLTLSALSQPLFRFYFPKLSSAASEEGAFLRLGRRVFRMAFLLGGGMALAVGLGAPALVGLIFGPGYEEAASVARALSPWLLLSALSLVWGYLALVPLGRDRAHTLLLMGAVAVHIFLAWLLASRWGGLGMALALVGSAGALALGQALFLRFWVKVSPAFREEL